MEQVILLSYPRSGNTWCRYILEVCFAIRTFGYNSKIDIAPLLYTLNGFTQYRNDICVIKRHNKIENFSGKEKLILISRDKDTAIQRQRQDSNAPYHAENDLYELNNAEYRKWEGSKMIIYYVDLLNHPEKVVSQLSDFLGIKAKPLGNVDSHRENSLKLYCEIGNNKSLTFNKNI